MCCPLCGRYMCRSTTLLIMPHLQLVVWKREKLPWYLKGNRNNNQGTAYHHMAILGGSKFLARFQFQAIPPTLCTTVQKLCPASLFLPEGTKVDISPFRSIRSLILMVTVPPLLQSPAYTDRPWHFLSQLSYKRKATYWVIFFLLLLSFHK